MRIFANKRLQKAAFVVIITLILITVTSARASAATDSENAISSEVQGLIDELFDAVPDGVQPPRDVGELSERVGIKAILEELVANIRGERGRICTFMLTLVGASALMALSSSVGGEMGAACRGGVSVIISGVIIAELCAPIRGAVDCLGEINGFFGAVIPIVAAVNALGLSGVTASMQSMSMAVTLQIYSTLSGEFLLGAVGAMLTLSALSCLDGGVFGGVCGALKRAFGLGLGLLSALVGALFSLQTLIAGCADSAAVRTARYAISNMIPIVGNTVSGAFSTLAGAVSYARGAVGGGAIAVILSLLLAPLVTLLAYRVCIAIAAFFVGLCALEGAGRLLGSLGSVLDSVIAVYTLTAVIYIAQLAVFTRGGGGA